MVKIRHEHHLPQDLPVDTVAWVSGLVAKRGWSADESARLTAACEVSLQAARQNSDADTRWPAGNCLLTGLEMASILSDLN